MELAHVSLFILFLVAPIFSFPRPKGASSPSNSTVIVVDPKTVKFPSPSEGLKNRSEIVRTPSGAWSGGKRSPGSESKASDPDRIVFLDDPEPNKFVPKIEKRSPQCAKSTFCEEVADYPSSYIDSVLPNTAIEFRSLFGKDIVRETNIVHRIDSADEYELCPSLEQVVYPKSAKNKDDKWRYIINQGEYVQGVRVEKCLSTGDSGTQSCLNSFKDFLPISYKATCKQKFILRKMLALNEDGQTISDSFLLPSCCSCTISTDRGGLRLGDPGSRMSPARKQDATKKPSTSR